jgi:hypothetical protein
MSVQLTLVHDAMRISRGDSQRPTCNHRVRSRFHSRCATSDELFRPAREWVFQRRRAFAYRRLATLKRLLSVVRFLTAAATTNMVGIGVTIGKPRKSNIQTLTVGVIHGVRKSYLTALRDTKIGGSSEIRFESALILVTLQSTGT